jgi:hypothetical protein
MVKVKAAVTVAFASVKLPPPTVTVIKSGIMVAGPPMGSVAFRPALE